MKAITPTPAAAKLIASLPEEIEKAARRIGPHVLKTPLLESPYLSSSSEVNGSKVFLKLESEQVTGSFKARGSLNKILCLQKQQQEDESPSLPTLVTSSTGNHAQGFARAVQIVQQQQQQQKISSAGTNKEQSTLAPGIIFMPTTAQAAKVDAIKQCYPNVQIEFHGQDCAVTEEHALNYAQQNKNMVYVPPYNDPDVIAGQGTVGLEILQDQPDIDVVFVCIGGGGLVSGVASYLKAKKPNIKIVGCQPQNSPEMYLSVQKGELVYLDEPLETLSDGSAGGIEPGAITFDICQALVDDYVLVSEDEIATAIRWMVNKHHKIIEGAAGVALAAFQKTSNSYAGQKIAIVICGSNIGTEKLQGILAG